MIQSHDEEIELFNEEFDVEVLLMKSISNLNHNAFLLHFSAQDSFRVQLNSHTKSSLIKSFLLGSFFLKLFLLCLVLSI